MVFQNYALYPHMSVFDNMAFGLKMRKVPKPEIVKRVHEAAKILGIEHLLDRKPRELSGGQRQRVALGRAIVRNPKVFLFDEPLSNLDAKMRVRMRAELAKLHKKLQATSIYVTHDQVEAMTMGDRIAVMNQGKLLQVGPPTEVYLKPNSIFVATFIGAPEMNLLEVSVKEKENSIILEGEGFEIPLPSDFKELLENYTDKTVVFGIRPEHMTIEGVSSLEHVKRSTTIEGTVDFIEALGTDTIVHANIGSGHVIKVKLPGHIPLEVRSKVRIVIDLDNIHVFDKNTGKAII